MYLWLKKIYNKGIKIRKLLVFHYTKLIGNFLKKPTEWIEIQMPKLYKPKLHRPVKSKKAEEEE